MKKHLYLLFGGLFAFGIIANGQSSKSVNSNHRAIDVSAPLKAKPRAVAKDFGDPIWIDTFENLNNWTVSNESTPSVDWIHTTNAGIIPVAALSPFASTTVANGFAFIDGDGQGEGSVQNSNLTLANSINLTDYPNVSLVFEQNTRNFASTYYVRVSIDNGFTWNEIQVNTALATNTNTDNPSVTVVNISALAGGQSQVKIEFNFTANWGWHWAIDDVAIVETPADDLSLLSVYYDDYISYLQLTEFLDVDYLKELEYSSYKTGQVRPLTFGAVVENQGQNPSTGVFLTATVTTPSGVETFTSTPTTVAPGDQVLIQTAPQTLAAFAGGGVVGNYTVSIAVTMDAEDQVPENNVALAKSFSVNTDEMANDLGNTWATFFPTLGQDVIWGSRYMFEQQTPINYIKFAVLSTTAAPTQAGEIIYLNMRTGSVTEPESAINVMNRLYGEEEIGYVLNQADFTTSGAAVTYITMMLPDQLTASPNVIYQPEVEVLFVGEDYMWIPFSNQQEDVAGVLFEYGDVSGGAQGWWTLGGNSPHIRMGFNESVGVDGPSDLDFKIGQNYPNPTTGSTRIDWELLEPAENVQFRITDINGKTVFSKDLGNRPAGVQESLELNLNLAAGSYQYGLQIGNHVIVRKMVITK